MRAKAMAAGILKKPGSQYGPCLPTCRHLDCDETRTMAESPCRICSGPIGYDTRFYQDSNGGQPRTLSHADCSERELQKEFDRPDLDEVDVKRESGQEERDGYYGDSGVET